MIRSADIDAHREPVLDRKDSIVIAVIIGWGLLCLLPSLGHPMIPSWDESMHQAATRGVYEEFLRPHIYADPFYPLKEPDWLNAGVYLHKPIGPFWLGAAMMHITGPDPIALRLGSLLATLLAACSLYWLLRRAGPDAASRAWAALGAMAFLALPFGWALTQGYQFGDVTDCTLAGGVALAMAIIVASAASSSWRLAALAGAATGAAYLCKSSLALAPLAVAFLLWLWREDLAGGRMPGRAILTMLGGFIAVAAPWNLYAHLHWPELYRAESRITLDRLLNRVPNWDRPVDAILNEINQVELQPLPVALMFVAALWLLVRAMRTRRLEEVALASWLWLSWIVLSIVSAKPPAIVWGAVPAALASLIYLGRHAAESPAWAGATVFAASSVWWMEQRPALSRVRSFVPILFEQTRQRPGLAEGLVLAAGGAFAFAMIHRALRRPIWFSRAAGIAAVAALVWNFGPKLYAAHKKTAASMTEERGGISYTKEIGRALDRVAEKRSVLFVDVDLDSPGTFEVQNLIFWSGKMAYRRSPDLATADAKGYHAYLVSPAAEPYAVVEGVPDFAWLRAYDLARPGVPPAPPAGAVPLGVEMPQQTVLGVAAGAIDSKRDRYAFFVRSKGVPSPLRVAFHTREGAVIRRVIAPEQSLRRRERLRDAAWFVLPAIGPRRVDVAILEIEGERRTLPPP